MRRILAHLLACALAVTGLVTLPASAALAAPPEHAEYTLYPIPQQVAYASGDVILRDFAAIYDPGIDQATKDRLKEVATLKGLSLSEASAPQAGKTTIYVGIRGSNGPAAQAIEAAGASDAAAFEKTDAYQLSVRDGTISVLGKDTDAAFYGLTTLYQVVAQADSRTIRPFTVTDWADVASRGFIEGYYGNPWSTQDRVNLMRWSGYFKANSYFYAPKDDPKHNAKWRELYTDEELATKIRPLAEAGNASKTRFVFALHPFMNAPLRFDDNYPADFQTLTAKFDQAIGAGARQIALLADDAWNYGGDNYVRVMTDLTAWVKQKQQTYPDLKTIIPFVPVEYGGWGSEAYMKKMPANVPIVMTGGRVWGEVSADFTQKFKANSGRGSYLWINWPCTDNSKRHLIMGGFKDFLHPNVSPEDVEGIVLNPMQQSEPSKVAIFANAAYAWNIWDSAQQADEAWDKAFAFVDHNTALPTPASDALRELSKHMINQAMDTRVRALQESVELKDILNPVKDKLQAGTLTADDLAPVRAEFEKLQRAAQTFRTHGNTALLGDIDGDYSRPDANEQMAPWMDSWRDTTTAALTYLDAVAAGLAGDTDTLLAKASQAKAAFTASQSHEFFYVNHNERAEVGVQHIVPFIRALETWVNQATRQLANPDQVSATYISDVFTSPTSGTIDDILDGNDDTAAEFRNPNFLNTGNYVGLQFSKPTTLTSVRFAFGGGKNHFYYPKLQVKQSGEWTDVPGKTFERPNGSTEPIEVTGLNLAGVEGVRLIATRDNGQDLWLNLKGIDYNYATDQAAVPYTASTVELQGLEVAPGSPAQLPAASDGNPASAVWLRNATHADNTPKDGAVIVDLGSPKAIGSVKVLHGDSAAPGDRASQAVVEVSTNKSDWTEFATLADKTDQTVTGSAQARYVRVRATSQKAVWWRVRDISVVAPEQTAADVYTNLSSTAAQGLSAHVATESARLTGGPVTLGEGDYVGLDFGSIRRIQSATVPTEGVVLEASDNGLTWRTVENASALAGQAARLVRIRNAGPEKQVTVTPFAVTFTVPGEFGRLVSSTIPVNSGWGDARDNGAGFDNNMSTATKFGGNPQAGNEAIYDLGRPVDVRSLRIYTHDSELDYIRDATIQVGTSPSGPWTDVLTIGDTTTDTDRTTTFGSIVDPAKKTDSTYPNYVYYGNDQVGDGQGVTGRYLRIQINATYPTRALRFNEIVLNQGAYISPETNPAFQATVPEERGHQPSFLLDGDPATTYLPSADNGQLTYRLANGKGVGAFRLLQVGEPSGATVTGHVVDPATGEQTEVTFGTLEQAMNEFVVPAGKVLADVTIAWGTKRPEIAEFLARPTAEDGAAAKPALRQAWQAQPEGADQWTTGAKDGWAALVARARAVEASPNVSRETVEQMTRALGAYTAQAERKASADQLDRLRTAVAAPKSNDDHFYTVHSFARYERAVDAVTDALKAPDALSRDEANRLLSEVTAATEALRYSVFQREEAELAIADFDAVNAADYTTASYKAFQDARQAIVDSLTQDKATAGVQVEPATFKQLRDTYVAARQGLVNVAELKAQLAHEYDEQQYTPESWKAYQDARKAAEAVLVDGTTQQVADALATLKAAEAALTQKPSSDVEAALAELEKLPADDYTTDSYKALADAIAAVRAGTGTLDQAKAARDALVSVVALRAKLAEAGRLKPDTYTTSSWAPLADLLAQKGDEATERLGVTDLLTSGTPEQIAARVAAIDAAIEKLVPRQQGLVDYVNAIMLAPQGDYTPESYAPYKAAYDALGELAKDPADVSTEQFRTARDAFEKARAALKKVGETGQPDTDEPGKPGTDEPGKPGTDEPGTPDTNEPGKPGTDEPGTPDTDEPGKPGTDEPGKPDTHKPGTPDTEEPGTPAQPVTGNTGTPQTSRLVKTGVSAGLFAGIAAAALMTGLLVIGARRRS